MGQWASKQPAPQQVPVVEEAAKAAAAPSDAGPPPPSLEAQAPPQQALVLPQEPGVLDAAAEAAAAGPQDMPYVHTHLTERFQGKFRRLEFPTFEQMMAEDAMNNCAVRSAMAGAGGALLGAAFGIFTASLDTGGIDSAVTEEAKPTRVVLRETLTLMRTKSVSYAKGFAIMGLVYSGCECVIEKRRARHDRWNAPLAGCAAGAIMAAPAGPQAMCFGCASFAAFSYAIDHFMGLS